MLKKLIERPKLSVESQRPPSSRSKDPGSLVEDVETCRMSRRNAGREGELFK